MIDGYIRVAQPGSRRRMLFNLTDVCWSPFVFDVHLLDFSEERCQTSVELALPVLATHSMRESFVAPQYQAFSHQTSDELIRDLSDEFKRMRLHSAVYHIPHNIDDTWLHSVIEQVCLDGVLYEDGMKAPLLHGSRSRPRKPKPPSSNLASRDPFAEDPSATGFIGVPTSTAVGGAPMLSIADADTTSANGDAPIVEGPLARENECMDLADDEFADVTAEDLYEIDEAINGDTSDPTVDEDEATSLLVAAVETAVVGPESFEWGPDTVGAASSGAGPPPPDDLGTGTVDEEPWLKMSPIGLDGTITYQGKRALRMQHNKPKVGTITINCYAHNPSCRLLVKQSLVGTDMAVKKWFFSVPAGDTTTDAALKKQYAKRHLDLGKELWYAGGKK